MVNDRTRSRSADNILNHIPKMGGEGGISVATVGAVFIDATSVVLLEKRAWGLIKNAPLANGGGLVAVDDSGE